MSKKILLSVAAVAAIGAGGYFVLGSAGSSAIAEEIERIKADLPAGQTLETGDVSASVLSQEAVISDIRYTVDGTTVMAASATVGSLDEKKFPRSLSFKDLTIEDDNGDVLTVGNVDIDGLDMERADSAEAFAHAFSKASIDSLVIKEIKALDARSANKPVTVKELRIEDMVDGKASEFVMTGFAGADPDNGSDVRIETVNVADLDWSIIALDEDSPEFQKAMSNMLGVTSLVVEGLSVHSADAKITIESTGIKDVERSNGVITAAHLYLDKLVLPLDGKALGDNMGRDGQKLAMLGQMIDSETLTASTSVKWDIDPSAGTADFGPVEIDLSDLGHLEASFSISDMDTERLANAFAMTNERKMQREIQDIASKGSLSEISIRYEDDKLADLILESVAPGDQRYQMIQMVTAQATMAIDSPVHAEMVADALSAFLTDTGGFEITAAPSEPVPAMNIAATGGPAEAIDLLNITVKGW